MASTWYLVLLGSWLIFRYLLDTDIWLALKSSGIGYLSTLDAHRLFHWFHLHHPWLLHELGHNLDVLAFQMLGKEKPSSEVHIWLCPSNMIEKMQCPVKRLKKKGPGADILHPPPPPPPQPAAAALPPASICLQFFLLQKTSFHLLFFYRLLTAKLLPSTATFMSKLVSLSKNLILTLRIRHSHSCYSSRPG